MCCALVRTAVLLALLFNGVVVAFAPTRVSKILPNPGVEVTLNRFIDGLETLEVFLRSPYLVEQGLSPFQIESILVSAVKESEGTRDSLRYHILETKIAQVETILYDMLLSARQHSKEDDVLAYEHMRDKNAERLRIHQDVVSSLKSLQWGLYGAKTEPNEDEAITTDYLYDARAESWGVFALTANNYELHQAEVEALLNTYRTNIEQQDLSSDYLPYNRSGVSDNHYALEDGWVHLAALLKNSVKDGEYYGKSESYLFDIMFALREHVDVRRVALLYAFKHHLRRQQVILMYSHVADHRPDISSAWTSSKGQEAFGVSLYHLLNNGNLEPVGEGFDLNAVNPEAGGEASATEQTETENTEVRDEAA